MSEEQTSTDAEADERTTTRVQIELPPQSMERLIALKQSTDAASYAEVCRSALRVYEMMVQETLAGKEFYTRDRDGNLTRIMVFAG